MRCRGYIGSMVAWLHGAGVGAPFVTMQLMELM